MNQPLKIVGQVIIVYGFYWLGVGVIETLTGGFGSICSVPSSGNIGCSAVQFIVDFAPYISGVILASLIYLACKNYGFSRLVLVVAGFFGLIILLFVVQGVISVSQNYSIRNTSISQLGKVNFVIDGFKNEPPRAVVNGDFRDLPHAEVTEALPRYGLFVGCGREGVYKYDVAAKSLSFLNRHENLQCESLEKENENLRINRVSSNGDKEKMSFDLDKPAVKESTKSYRLKDAAKNDKDSLASFYPAKFYSQPQLCNQSRDCVQLREGKITLKQSSGTNNNLELKNVTAILHLQENLLFFYSQDSGTRSPVTFLPKAEAVVRTHSFYVYDLNNNKLKALATNSRNHGFLLYPQYNNND